MRVFLTGNDGYLGSLLAPELMKRGHDVIGLDTGFYQEGTLYRSGPMTALTLVKDLRHVEAKDLKGVEAIVHMAELSNDPACQLAPQITYEINHKGSVRLAELAREVGVRRFIYMSSCSVYGVSDQEFVNEESPLNPQTAYAKCKTLVERDVSPMADDGFSRNCVNGSYMSSCAFSRTTSWMSASVRSGNSWRRAASMCAAGLGGTGDDHFVASAR